MPTETVYGLAGDARNPKAVAAIYALKNRPGFNPLIAHVSSLEMAEQEAMFSYEAMKLAEAFWPGPLTLVLPVAATNTICDLARAGLNTQAIRFPDHAIAQALITAFGGPIVAPSANKSGRISPTTASHVRGEFGESLECILDGGPTLMGLESTVMTALEDQMILLRPGSLSRESIEDVIGPVRSAIHDDTAPRSPGMLSRHYAPSARLRLNVTEPEPHEAWLGFGFMCPDAHMNLSASGDIREAAANLYAMLRKLDETYEAIAIAPIPDTGLGEAINDRLIRACR